MPIYYDDATAVVNKSACEKEYLYDTGSKTVYHITVIIYYYYYYNLSVNT